MTLTVHDSAYDLGAGNPALQKALQRMLVPVDATLAALARRISMSRSLAIPQFLRILCNGCPVAAPARSDCELSHEALHLLLERLVVFNLIGV